MHREASCQPCLQSVCQLFSFTAATGRAVGDARAIQCRLLFLLAQADSAACKSGWPAWPAAADEMHH